MQNKEIRNKYAKQAKQDKKASGYYHTNRIEQYKKLFMFKKQKNK